jgi:diguanylate cyclase (GGDEF)-like protein
VNAKNRLCSGYGLNFEKAIETANLLSNEINNKTKDITSISGKLERYNTLKVTAESFSASLTLDNITRLITDRMSKTIQKPGRSLVFLVDTGKQALMLSASSRSFPGEDGPGRGTDRVKTKKGDIFDHWVLRHRRSLIVEDITRDYRFPIDEGEASAESFKSIISAPMVTENKVIGILRMDSSLELAYTQDDLRLLDILADLGALAVGNSLLYSKTQELAIKDSLTGLSVRRYFMERLKEEIKRSGVKSKKFSLLMIDIDRFKEYNDQHGHTSGDLVLKHLSGILNAASGDGDIVARYGGEEMVLLLSGSDRAKAAEEADKIRRIIKESPLKLRRQDANVTVSIGVSVYPDDGRTEEGLIRAADERLYKAKADGRDRVCSA